MYARLAYTKFGSRKADLALAESNLSEPLNTPERRGEPRHPIHFECEISCGPNIQSLQGHLVDISQSGVRIISPAVVTSGLQVEIALLGYCLDGPVLVVGTVRHIKPEGSLLVVGIHLDEISRESEHWTQLVDHAAHQ